MFGSDCFGDQVKVSIVEGQSGPGSCDLGESHNHPEVSSLVVDILDLRKVGRYDLDNRSARLGILSGSGPDFFVWRPDL